LITGASDDDPSAVITYAMVGARLGTGIVWTMLYILPFMIVIQEMSARIGLSSSCGLAGNLKKYYSKTALFFIATLIIISNLFNIGADVYGMSAALELIIPWSSHLFSWLLVVIILLLVVYLPYRKIVAIFKWLTFSLFAYMVAALLVIDNWHLILIQLFVPALQSNRDYLLLFVAVAGTTISPYLAFWQASEEAEERKNELGRSKNLVCRFRVFDDKDLERTKIDTRIGMFFSNLIGFFIIALTGTLLFNAGIHNVETVKDIADALRPLAGDFAYFLFAIGIIGAGMLTIPILAGSSAYVLSEIFNWKGSLDKPFSKAREFYLVIIVATLLGLVIPYTGITAVQALFWTAIIHGIVAPFLIIAVIHMANNPAIVGPNVNSRRANYFAFGSFVLMSSIMITIFVLEFPTDRVMAIIGSMF